MNENDRPLDPIDYENECNSSDDDDDKRKANIHKYLQADFIGGATRPISSLSQAELFNEDTDIWEILEKRIELDNYIATEKEKDQEALTMLKDLIVSRTKPTSLGVLCRGMKLVIKNQHKICYKEKLKPLAYEMHNFIYSYLENITLLEVKELKKEWVEIFHKVFEDFYFLVDPERREEFNFKRFDMFISTILIKKGNLDKRLVGVKVLSSVFKKYKEYIPEAIKIMEEHKIFDEIFGQNHHLQLIAKSDELLFSMMSNGVITIKEIDILWGLTQKAEIELKNKVYTLFVDAHRKSILLPDHLHYILSQFFKLSLEEIEKEELITVYELCSFDIVNDQEIEACLNMNIQFFFSKPIILLKTSERIATLLAKNPSFKTKVIDTCMDMISRFDKTQHAYYLLKKVLMICFSDDKDFYTKIIKSKSLAKLIVENFTQFINNPEKEKGTRSNSVDYRLKLITQMLIRNFWLLDDINIIEYMHSLLNNNSSCISDKAMFFDWLLNLIDKRNIDRDKIFGLMRDQLNSKEENFYYLIPQEYKVFRHLFLEINEEKGRISFNDSYIEDYISNDVSIVNVNVYPKKEAKELEGFEDLWKICISNQNTKIQDNAQKIVTSLMDYKAFNEDEIIYKGIDHLLEKCLQVVYKYAEADLRDVSGVQLQMVTSQLTRVLHFITEIVDKSERNSPSYIKAHRYLMKKKKRTIYVEPAIRGRLNMTSFKTKVFDNTTIWELKDILSKHTKIPAQLINISTLYASTMRKEIGTGELNKTVELFDYSTIRIDAINPNKFIERVPLLVDDQPVPEVIAIFSEWFDRWSDDGQMTRAGVIDCIKEITKVYEDINENDPRVIMLFENYTKEGQDYLEKDDFIKFFSESCMTPEKQETVWENLKKMGIRNDLKKMDDDYEFDNVGLLEEMKKSQLYILSHNPRVFDSLIKILSINNTIAIKSYSIINKINTNINVYMRIIKLEEDPDTGMVKWETVLNYKEINTLIYNLQIIDSIIEDIELGNDPEIESHYSDESLFELYSPGTKLTMDEIYTIKLEWLKKFYLKGGFNFLIHLLHNLIDVYMHPNDPDIKSNNAIYDDCISKVCRFINSSYQHAFMSQKDTSSGKIELVSRVKELIHEDKAIIETLSGLNYMMIISDLLVFIQYIFEFNENKINKEEAKLIDQIYDIVCKLLIHTENLNLNDLISNSFEDFKKTSISGLLNDKCKVVFYKNLVYLVRKCKSFAFSEFPLRLFQCLFESMKSFTDANTISQLQQSNSAWNFDDDVEYESSTSLNFFIKLLVELFETLIDLKEIEKLLPYITAMIDAINEEVMVENKAVLPLDIFCCYVNIIDKLYVTNTEIQNICKEKNVIDNLLLNVLFLHYKQQKKEDVLELTSEKYINLDSITFARDEKFYNKKFTESCFKLVGSLMFNSMENIDKYFEFTVSANVVLEKQNSYEDNRDSIGNEQIFPSTGLNSLIQRSVRRRPYIKYREDYTVNSSGFVGLKNLGCICYMNAMLQQFFMIPTFRYALMQADDKKPENTEQEGNEDHIDDNVLHQIQKMFAYLTCSKRGDYNMKEFCFSFKDFSGKPTSHMEQKDAQEFLNMFFDKLEHLVQDTEYKYIIDSVFGFRTQSKIICGETDCQAISESYEKSLNLSLECKNIKDIYKSLDKLIKPEKIDGYKCGRCQKQTTITKSNGIYELPNVLTIHLQRIYFDLDNLCNVKNNEKFEFPHVLNLEKYTIEGIEKNRLQKEKIKAAGGQTNEQDDKADDKANEENTECMANTKEVEEEQSTTTKTISDVKTFEPGLDFIKKKSKKRENLDLDTEEVANDEVKDNDKIGDVDGDEKPLEKKLDPYEVQETESLYFKHSSYYQYFLKGIVIHVGSADAGHYFSYINTIRDGSGFEVAYDQDNLMQFKSWMEFNDSTISKFKIEEMKKEAFGGDFSQSAYMLIYERKFKNPIKILYKTDEAIPDEDLIEFKADEDLKMNKELNILKFKSIEEVRQHAEYLYSKKFYDAKKEEKFYLKPFYSFNRLIDKEIYQEIAEDNIVLLKNRNEKDSIFVNFSNTLTQAYERSLSSITLETAEEAIEFTKKLITRNFGLLLSKDKNKFIRSTAAKLTDILKFGSFEIVKTCVSVIFNDYYKTGKLKDILFNDSTIVSGPNNELFLEIIKEVLKVYNDEFSDAVRNKAYSDLLEDNIVDQCVLMIYYIFSFIPNVPTDKLCCISSVLLAYKKLYEADLSVQYFFLRDDRISLLITFLIGKTSPYYEKSVEKYGEWYDEKRPEFLGPKSVIDLIYMAYMFNQRSKRDTGNDILSASDIECIESLPFLTYLSDNHDTNQLTLELTFKACIDNEEQTIKLIEPWMKKIKDIYYTKSEIISVFSSIRSILKIKDSLQQMRFEMLFGLPQLKFEEKLNSGIYNFGYHVSPKKTFTYCCTNRNYAYSCFFDKIFETYNFDEYTQNDFFKLVYEECLENDEFHKYILTLPAGNLDVYNMYQAMYKVSSSIAEKTRSPDFLASVQAVKNKLIDKIKGYNELPTPCYQGRYLQGDIKREEITVLKQEKDLYLLRIEYFTEIIEYSTYPEIDWSHADWQCTSSHYDNSDDEDISEGKQFDVENNLKESDDYLLIPSYQKGNDEYDFLVMNTEALNMAKKIIIENPYVVNGPVKSSLIRFALLNKSRNECNVNVQLSPAREVEGQKLNQYIPKASMQFKLEDRKLTTIYLMPRIDINMDWTDASLLNIKLVYTMEEDIIYDHSNINNNVRTYHHRIPINITNYQAGVSHVYNVVYGNQFSISDNFVYQDPVVDDDNNDDEQDDE